MRQSASCLQAFKTYLEKTKMPEDNTISLLWGHIVTLCDPAAEVVNGKSMTARETRRIS